MSKVESYLLGMDCGTTSLKAIILGEDGTVVAEASRPSTFMDLKSDMREQEIGRASCRERVSSPV